MEQRCNNLQLIKLKVTNTVTIWQISTFLSLVLLPLFTFNFRIESYFLIERQLITVDELVED